MSEKLEKIRLLVRSECEASDKLAWFYSGHIVVVEKDAELLTEKLGADREVVILGALLHDIARIRKVSEEEHDLAGAPIAEEIMRNHGYNNEVIEKVKGLILTHRCGERKPKTLGEKILASADAMSHFQGDFYLRLAWIHGQEGNFKEYVNSSLKKMERDFHEKIFFDAAREVIKDNYEALKRIFSNAANTAED